MNKCIGYFAGIIMFILNSYNIEMSIFTNKNFSYSICQKLLW